MYQSLENSQMKINSTQVSFQRRLVGFLDPVLSLGYQEALKGEKTSKHDPKN